MDEWKLYVPVIHGIGLQNQQMQTDFVDRVRELVAGQLPDSGKEELLARLELFNPMWDQQYRDESNTWMARMLCGEYPQLSGCAQATGRVDQETAESIYKESCTQATSDVKGSLWGTAFGAVKSFFNSGTARMLQEAGGYFNWGAAITIGRNFQAHTLSDIVIYLSNEARAKIMFELLSRFAEKLPPASMQNEATAAERKYILLCGHSLGSVIAYDLLRAMVSWEQKQAEQRDHPHGGRATYEFSEAQLSGMQMPTGTENAWEYVVQLLKQLTPVGLITFGAPVPFFLFRKPELMTQPTADTGQALWEQVCPAAERASFRQVPRASDSRGAFWLNFFHPSDFVAHRCAPLFNRGAPFVEDIEVKGRFPDGIKAHSGYWGEKGAGATGNVVELRIAEQIAQRLKQLGAGNA